MVTGVGALFPHLFFCAQKGDEVLTMTYRIS